MNINADKAALVSGVETKGSITNFNQKGYRGDSNTWQAMSRFSPPFWPQKSKCLRNMTVTEAGQSLGVGSILLREKFPQMILLHFPPTAPVKPLIPAPAGLNLFF